MYRIIFSFLFAVTVLVIASDPVFAQRHAGYCDDSTRTTADALDCVNRQKQDVQERLNGIYRILSDKQESSGATLLRLAQQSWLSYRDTQCAWEADLATNPSLRRIYELSCITLLTNLRSDLLSTTLEQEKDDMPREFSTSPRWMNVLVHDYPDIFWRYGKWLHADLDCDGADDHVMAGVKVSFENNRPVVEVVIAVTENPVAGKPHPRLFYVPVSDVNSGSDASLCRADISMLLSDNPLNAETASSCNIGLKITDKTCPDVILSWTGDDYVLSGSGQSEKE